MARLQAEATIQSDPGLDAVTFGAYGQSVHARATASAQATAAQQASAQDARLSQGMAQQQGPPAAGTNYQQYSHPQLHGMVNNNVDPSGLYESGDSWTQVGNGYADSANNVTGMVGTSESMWQGAAGDAARSALTQTANWFGSAAQGAQATGNHLYIQSQAASNAKNSMPAPVAFNQNNAVMALLTGGSGAYSQNIAQQVQASEDARQQAIHAVQTYDSTLGHTSGAMPAFAPPPQFTPGANAPSGTQPSSATGGTGLRGSAVPRGPRASAVAPSGSGGMPTGQRGFVGSGVPVGQQTGTSDFTGGGSISGVLPTGGQDARGLSPASGAPGGIDVTGGMPAGAGLGQLGNEQVRTGTGFGGGAAGRGGGAAGSGGGFAGGRPGTGAPSGGQGGGQSGARSGAGAMAAEEAAIQRGVAGGRAGAAAEPGMGGGGMGRGAKKDEDKEHKAAAYLRENNADNVFTEGMPRTVPPTIGE